MAAAFPKHHVNPRKLKAIKDRFALKYEPVTESGCWLWTSGTIRGGYGMIWDKSANQNISAHRLSWEINRGTVPAGMNVLHKCDTPSCVNPDHLFIGTDADNVADKIAKGRGRGPRGEEQGHSILTKEQVIAIRADPRVQKAIAANYGVNQQQISKIKRRLSWQHVA